MQAPTVVPASFSVILLVAVVSLLVLAAVAYFGFYLNHFRGRQWPPHVEELLHFWIHQGPKPDAALITSVVDEWYARRNEFWTSYGQFMLSGFVIAAITILLLTRTISAEAGLPVLAGVGGFAIGKGSSGRSGGSPTGGNAG